MTAHGKSFSKARAGKGNKEADAPLNTVILQQVSVRRIYAQCLRDLREPLLKLRSRILSIH